ncbi:MAG TPA: hypothetical protein VFS77_09260 [Pyrinomonadaceae bacterium]|nr:hypothetical protein [Pyrinomonadaceae bacterium]
MNQFIFRIAVIAVAFLLQMSIAFACSCGALVPVLDAYESAEVVVVARVLSVERSKEQDKRVHYGGVTSSRLVVEKVYKGDVRAGDELEFFQGGGADCVWAFRESDIGKQSLLYIGRPPAGEKWRAFTCGRSNSMKNAAEDLLYLDKLDQVRGKTRVSGKYGLKYGNSGLVVANRTIKIVGQNKTYETTTNADGIFEIYDLPAGNYRLEPEIPAGWQLDRDSLWFSSSADRKQTVKNAVAFKLEPKKHASIDLAFERVTDAP